MSFFSGHSYSGALSDDDDDDDSGDSRMPEWFGPPGGVMGGVVPVDDVLFRDEHVFVGFSGVTAYATGLTFDVHLAVRRGDWSRERWDDFVDDFWEHRHRRRSRGRDAGDRFKMGVELSDGQRGIADGRHEMPFSTDNPPEPPVVVEQGGGGSGGARVVDQRQGIWVWPLPQGDYIELVIEWPAMGVPLTRFRVDGALARAAAERAKPYWPQAGQTTP